MKTELTKENVFVKVENQIQADFNKNVLVALGEQISKEYYPFDDSHFYLVFRSGSWYLSSISLKQTEVTLKELIQIIANEKPKSILDGKVAIQVNNEREFKLLMQHYKEKGFNHKEEYVANTGGGGTYVAYKKDYTQYEVGCRQGFDLRKNGYKGISFEQFAKEIGIEVPVFVMTSEDGVDLYVGDDFCWARFKNKRWFLENHEYYYCDKKHTFTFKSSFEEAEVIINPKTNKAFSTKEAALAFVEENNKPKEIVVTMNAHSCNKAVVTKNQVVLINNGYNKFHLNHIELEEIYQAYKKLNS